MNVRNDADLKKLVSKDLKDKGVEASTADYPAELFAASEKGKEISAAGKLTAVGNCNSLGILPGG